MVRSSTLKAILIFRSSNRSKTCIRTDLIRTFEQSCTPIVKLLVGTLTKAFWCHTDHNSISLELNMLMMGIGKPLVTSITEGYHHHACRGYTAVHEYLSIFDHQSNWLLWLDPHDSLKWQSPH